MKISSRSTKVAELIRDRVPFQTYGALQAKQEDSVYGRTPGYLSNPADVEAWKRDSLHCAYVVYSYSTPIAWWTEQNGWWKVTQKFSMTTSHHQGKLYLIEQGEGGTDWTCPHADCGYGECYGRQVNGMCECHGNNEGACQRRV